MYSVYFIVGLFLFLIGVVSGIITALIIRALNKKSVASAKYEYSKYDRKKLMADQETLLKGREDHASKEFK